MRIEPNMADPDAFYAALVAAVDGRTDAESLRFALRLCLLLANQVGDPAVLREAVAAARQETAA